MKPNTHPVYGPVRFRDQTTGEEFLTQSTLAGKLEPAEGETVPVVTVDVSASSHPFWTGKKSTLDNEGRVAAFERRYGKK